MRSASLLPLALMAFFLPACASEKDSRQQSGQEPSGPNPKVAIETSFGTIKAELFQKESPATVKNFLAYVDDKFYDGTVVHRVIDGFMIQGGGFLPGMEEKETRGPIKNESTNGLKNERGTLAMARLPDPDSATAQFYINLDHNDQLDFVGGRPAYTVFGKVTDGMEVVDKIAKVRTGRRFGHKDVPLEDVTIKSIRRADAK